MTDKASSPAATVIARFGGQTALAKRIGVSQSVVWGWANAGRIPYSRVPVIVAAGRRAEPPIILTSEDFLPIPPAEAPA